MESHKIEDQIQSVDNVQTMRGITRNMGEQKYNEIQISNLR